MNRSRRKTSSDGPGTAFPVTELSEAGIPNYSAKPPSLCAPRLRHSESTTDRYQVHVETSHLFHHPFARYTMHFTPRATDAPEPYVVPPSDKFDGADGSWSTFTISVGTPGQDFRVLPSTKGGVTYVIAEEGCLDGLDPVDCPQLRGIEVFQSAQIDNMVGHRTIRC
jgi:hypothetical protein